MNCIWGQSIVGSVYIKIKSELKKFIGADKNCGARWKRGSIIVDAAISLPIFLIAMCTILSLLLQVGREDNAMLSMFKTSQTVTRTLAATGYTTGQGASDEFLGALGQDNEGIINTLEQGSEELINSLSQDDRGDLYLFKEGHVLVFRPFIGEKSESDGDRVYIFPKYGERYHIEGCSTLRNGERVEVLTDKVKRQYKACEICKPDELPNGATVCIYSDVSHTYHRESCATITKSYECISRKDAIDQGYTACQLCLKDF